MHTEENLSKLAALRICPLGPCLASCFYRCPAYTSRHCTLIPSLPICSEASFQQLSSTYIIMFLSLQDHFHKHKASYNFPWLKRKKKNPLIPIASSPTSYFPISLIRSTEKLSFLSSVSPHFQFHSFQLLLNPL